VKIKINPIGVLPHRWALNDERHFALSYTGKLTCNEVKYYFRIRRKLAQCK